MIDDISELLGVSQDLMQHAFVVFLRIGAIVALLPAFGEQSVPVRVKLGIAFAFTAIVAPAVTLPDIAQNSVAMAGFLFAETITGVFLGLMLRLFVIALQVAGSIAAQSTSLSQLFGGAGADPLPAMGHVLVVGGLALATLMGLHVQFAEYMIFSYQIIPAGDVIPPQLLNRSGISEIARAFALGFSLAAPFVIASLLYNIVLGIINKAMPQLMVAFVGAPAITAGGLIILMLSAPLMLSLWVEAMGEFLMNPLRGPR